MKKALFTLLISIFFAPALGHGETHKKHTAQHTPTYEEATEYRLSSLGDFFSSSLLPIVQAELNLSVDQMLAIKDLKNSLVVARQRESHNFPESMPMSAEEEKETHDDCQKNAMRVAKLLGDEKLEDFCEWLREEGQLDVANGRRPGEKNKSFSELETQAEKIFDQYLHSPVYKTYKAKKTTQFDSEKLSRAFFEKHERGLELRILWALNGHSGPLFDQLLRLYAPLPNPSPHGEQGKKYYLAHHYAKAIKEYEAALQEDPANFDAYGLMGYSCFKLGQVNRAVTFLEKSTEVNQGYVMGHYNLALVYWAMDLKKKAVEEITKVIELDPSFQKILEGDSQFDEIFQSSEYKAWVANPSRFYLTPDNRIWWASKLMLSGVWDDDGHFCGVPWSQIPGLKADLEITDAQIAEVSNFLKCAHDAKDYLRINGIRDPLDSAPDTEVSAYLNFSNGAVKLAGTLGKTKWDDLCQWLQEEQLLRLSVLGLGESDLDLSKADSITERVLSDLKKSDLYKAFLEKKKAEFDSENRFQDYLSMHDRILKLRIEDFLYGHLYPYGIVSPEKEQERQIIRKRLTEISAEFSKLNSQN